MLFVRTEPLRAATRQRRIGTLRMLIEEQREDGLAGLDRSAVIHGAEIPRVDYRLPKQLPEDIFTQLVDPANLARLREEWHRTAVLLLAFTGMRISSVITLPRDALTHGPDGQPYLRYWNIKLHRFPCRRRHGNRFMAIAVQRSKELPFGGRLAGDALERVRQTTLTALRFAALPRRLDFDDDARERWIEVYGPLSRGEEGLLGAATRRAEAHVVRLAAIYATLDCSGTIALPHLEAALAVWRYSLDSARWIFGGSLGDPTADEIWTLAKDGPNGITRTEVRDLFSRNKKAREID